MGNNPGNIVRILWHLDNVRSWQRGRATGRSVLEHTPGTACKEARYHRRCQGRWRGIVDLGKDDQGRRRTRKVSAATKAEAQAKLETVRIELAKGIRPRAGYTLKAAMDAWFESGLPGRSAKTLSTYREVTAPVLKLIGGKLLTELTADQVRAALTTTGRTRSSRTVEIAHRCLVRAIDHALASDLVSRNAGRIRASAPQGKAPGRASKSLTVAQARRFVNSEEAKKSRLYAYILLCLMTGIRTEEARALRWTEVDWTQQSMAVYRSVRSRGRRQDAEVQAQDCDP